MSTLEIVARRLVLCAAVLAGFGTACTAIVAAQLSDTKDLPVDGSGSSSSSSSAGGPTDKCSLRIIDRYSSSKFDPDASHPCLDCIEENCDEHLDYACDAGEEKPWFSQMRKCAQEPAVGYGNTFWGCGGYDQDADITTGTSEAAKESNARLCVKNSCLQGATPACKTCPISVAEPGSSSTKHLLDEEGNNCGKCLTDNCGGILVRCCSKPVVSNHVKFCAFLDNTAYRDDCADLNDGGVNPPADPTEEEQCDYDVRHCYRTECNASCPK